MQPRHTVGKEIFVIGFKLSKTIFARATSIPYLATVSIEDIFFDIVKVDEHHRVAGEWSSELKHDGFIGTLTNGVVVHQQYPVASYGTFDDSGDFKWKPRPAIDEEYQQINQEEPGVDFLTKVEKAVQQLNSKNIAVEYSQLESFVQNISYDVENSTQFTPEERIKMRRLEVHIVELFNKKYPTHKLVKVMDDIVPGYEIQPV